MLIGGCLIPCRLNLTLLPGYEWIGSDAGEGKATSCVRHGGVGVGGGSASQASGVTSMGCANSRTSDVPQHRLSPNHRSASGDDAGRCSACGASACCTVRCGSPVHAGGDEGMPSAAAAPTSKHTKPAQAAGHASAPHGPMGQADACSTPCRLRRVSSLYAYLDR